MVYMSLRRFSTRFNSRSADEYLRTNVSTGTWSVKEIEPIVYHVPMDAYLGLKQICPFQIIANMKRLGEMEREIRNVISRS